MVTTVKFSQFATANLSDTSNTIVGTGSGVNNISPKVVEWTTSTRPLTPFNGLLGYNTTISQYEYWDSVAVMWLPLASGESGTVSQVNTGTGLTGGPITTAGTVSFAPIAAHSLWANLTASVAVPTIIPTSTFLISADNLSDLPSIPTAVANLGLTIGVNVEAWNAQLDEISGNTWPGNTSITTLGTITSGTWNSVPITVAFGGTGNTSFTPWSVICAGTTSTGIFQNVVGVGAVDQVLTSNGAGALPTWKNSEGTGTVNSGLINELAWYAASGAAVSGLATANSSILVTNISGVPSFSNSLPSGTELNGVAFGPYATAVLGQLPGITTNTPASAGNIGEILKSNFSAVSITSGSNIDATSLNLTAGNWLIQGIIAFQSSGAGIFSSYFSGISITSATFAAAGTYAANNNSAGFGSTVTECVPVPTQQVTISTSTTYYLVAQSSFTTGTMSVTGVLFAQRIS